MKNRTSVSNSPAPIKGSKQTVAFRRIFGLTLLLTVALSAAPVHAQRTLHATPDTDRQHLPRLEAGDTLVLAPGVYDEGLPLRGLAGRAEAPIVITGPETGPPAVLVGRDGRITVSLIDIAHVTLRHLTLDGQGARAHGIVAEGRGSFAHDVTLEHLRIINFDATQAFNGISSKTNTWNWIIRNNYIGHVGTGMYLGNSNGREPFVAGLIENNLIEHTTGYNMQIKHQAPRPDLPGMPTTAQQTIIRNNGFDKSASDADAERARPNVLLGHWPLEGSGRDDRYLVYGNLFYQNPTERLFQAEGNVAAYNNVFVNVHGQAVSFQAHNDIPRNIDFHRNTVIGRGPAVTLTGADPAHAQHAVANLIYSETPPVGLSARDNRIAALNDITAELRAPLAPRDTLDLTPITPSPGAPALPPNARALPDIDVDFHGRPRDQTTFGAK